MKQEIVIQLQNVMVTTIYRILIKFCIDHHLCINTIIDTYCKHEFYRITTQKELTLKQSNQKNQSIQILHNLQGINYQGTQYWIDSNNLVYQQTNHLLSLIGIYNPELSLLYYS